MVDIAIPSIGATDTIVNNPGGALSNTNTVAQLAASAAGLASAVPGLGAAAGAAAVTLGEAAMSTGLAVLANDIQYAA